jgi:hypothetical protein
LVRPNFITHYNRAEPFRSLTSLSKTELAATLKKLNETNSWGLNRFSDPEYLTRRSLVETQIQQQFISIGGKPLLSHPIYFFLGRNERFEENKNNKAHIIQLKDIAPDQISFTYGDSMFCFNEDYRQQKGGQYLSELCRRVYKIEDLDKIFSHENYQNSERLHIEAQLWVKPCGTNKF